jgi:hypothetical protein
MKRVTKADTSRQIVKGSGFGFFEGANVEEEWSCQH